MKIYQDFSKLLIIILICLCFKSCKPANEVKDSVQMVNSLGEITDITLMDQGRCTSLGTFIAWLDSLPNKTALIILIDTNMDAASRNQLAILRSKNCTISVYSDSLYGRHRSIMEKSHQMVWNNVNVWDLWQITNAGSLGDVINIGQQSTGSGQKVMYIDSRYYTPDMERALKLKWPNVKIVSIRGPFLQGGNFLKLDDHLFVGRTFLDNIPTKDPKLADSIIRSVYNLPDSSELTIDFIGVKDPYLFPILYHLDLALTCTGLDKDSTMNFFVPYIPQSQISKNEFAANVSIALDSFANQIETLFQLRYKKKKAYRISRVPAYVDPKGDYICSPVNGLVDKRNNSTKYYFPWVSFDPPHDVETDTIYEYQRQALDTFKCRLGSDNVIAMPVPGDLVQGNSQSLHCTLCVVGRKRQ